MDMIRKDTDTIANGHHPKWTGSQKVTILNEHLYKVTEVLYMYAW